MAYKFDISDFQGVSRQSTFTSQHKDKRNARGMRLISKI